MNRRQGWLGGLLVALALAGLLSPWASRWPDGLERVAKHLGFADRGRRRPVIAAPMPDYQLPVSDSDVGRVAAAGIVGTLVVFGGACLLGLTLVRRGPRR
jgi:hypothetical protein